MDEEWNMKRKRNGRGRGFEEEWKRKRTEMVWENPGGFSQTSCFAIIQSDLAH